MVLEMEWGRLMHGYSKLEHRLALLKRCVCAYGQLFIAICMIYTRMRWVGFSQQLLLKYIQHLGGLFIYALRIYIAVCIFSYHAQ